jgi:dihydroorotate dehydrogenase (NAD+) catalytic subunit
VPVIVHVLAQRGDEVHQIMQHIERFEFIAGIEIGIPPEADLDIVAQLVGAAQGERPVIARLSLEQAVSLAPLALQSGAAADSLGASRGALPGPSGKPVRGRLYGPALFPQALEAVRQLVRLGVPVFAAGGVYQRWQVDAMLQAGAAAVQLDTVLWRGGFE